MVCIAITPAAFEAISATLPLGSVGYENAVDEKRQRLIWLDPSVLARLKAMRAPGESYSDVILRLARRAEAQATRYLRPSIHSVSACEPRPSAASTAALYPRRAWSLDMTPLVRGFSARSTRRPATAQAKAPMSTQMSARCFAQVSCSSRLFTSLLQRLRAEEAHDGLRLSEVPPGSNDGDGSGIEAAGGSKLIGRTGRKGGSSGIRWW
jgi:hypothetical protein